MSGSEFRTIANRRAVLKPLDKDCLLDGDLHPSIRLRLSRVRELPMTSVANLHGVERVGEQAFLIWDFAPGRTLEELLPTLDAAKRLRLKQDVSIVVQRMHGHGIVHGALHERNIIVDDRGQVRLTHVSPLLHNEETKDLAAVEQMFASLSPAAAEAVSAADGEPLRARAIFGAVVALIAGVLITVSIVWYASVHS